MMSALRPTNAKRQSVGMTDRAPRRGVGGNLRGKTVQLEVPFFCHALPAF